MSCSRVAGRLAGSLAGVALFASVASADLAAIKKNCDFKPEAIHVLIDANTGKVTGGTRFNAGAAVQVVLEHKNPFKYRYRVEVTAAPLEESIAANFLKLIPGLSTFSPVLGASGQVAAPAAQAALIAPCTAAQNNDLQALKAAVDTAKSTFDALTADLSTRVDVYKTYEKFVKDTDVDQLPTTCTALCDTAADLADKLGLLIKLGDLPAKAMAFTTAAQAVTEALKRFPGGTKPACIPGTGADVDFAQANALVAKAAEIQKQVDELKGAADSFTAMQALVKNVLEEMYPFNEPFYPPTVGNATGVTVVLFRTNLRQAGVKEQKIATVFIQIGESLVSVSAGLGFTFTPVKTIGRIASMVPGTDGKDTLGNRFDYLENSGQRPVAIATLNGRLPRPSAKSALARLSPDVLSTGVGFSLDGGPAQSEWLPVAVGWRAGSDHVLFVVGLHLTRSDCLPDPGDKDVACSSRSGFKVGEVVPAGLADPLPVERVWTRGILFGVTFRTQ
jgi:hypothetical protein